MGQQVCMGAMLTCTFGAAPGSMMVLPMNLVLTAVPDANIMDNKPMMNVLPFGMCQSMANPQLASATAAAQGVLTPQPCIPMTQSPWTPGSPQVTVGGNPALTDSSMCMCMWGGQISITTAGQQTTSVG